jgi:hypothetical protein
MVDEELTYACVHVLAIEYRKEEEKRQIFKLKQLIQKQQPKQLIFLLLVLFFRR